jgi:hypothetical protein
MRVARDVTIDDVSVRNSDLLKPVPLSVQRTPLLCALLDFVQVSAMSHARLAHAFACRRSRVSSRIRSRRVKRHRRRLPRRAPTWNHGAMQFRGILVGVVLAASSASAGNDRVERARAAVLTDVYQRALPGDGATAGSDAPTLHPGERGAGAEPAVDTRDEPGGFETGLLGRIVNLLMWGALIVGTVLLAFWIGAELLAFGADNAALADEAPVAPEGPDLRVIERPLGDAEELAARGEYGEAIHTLLLRTLQELVRSAEVRVSAAMTSREILGRVPLAADARDALAGLITAVEITHFGDDPATAADYERCRAQFQRFATAFRRVGREAAA